MARLISAYSARPYALLALVALASACAAAPGVVGRASRETTHASVREKTFDVAITGDGPPAVRASVERWIAASTSALMAFHRGQPPIGHATILASFIHGHGVSNGFTTGDEGAKVRVSVGDATTPAELQDDWILVHELVHVSFPDVHRPWAEEGLATYAEPIIRARAGLLAEDEVWRQLVLGLPKGQPETGDAGLDHTDTWGRRYWGGAMFWLLGDIAIRRASGNARGLDDVLRGISAAGGNITVTWSLDRALEVGDRAASSGTTLRDLRRKLGEAPVTVDLAALWRELGVGLDGGKVVYDDAAPLAAIRRGIGARAAR